MSTVALTIDYSNGAQKHFTGIPWKKGMTISSNRGERANRAENSVTLDPIGLATFWGS